MKKNFNNRFNVLVVFIFTIVFIGCTSENKEIPDVEDIPVEFELYRTEKAIAELDTTKVNILDQLYSVDSNFYSIYFERILQVPVSRMPIEKRDEFIKGFMRDKRINRIMNEVDSVYGDFLDMEDQLAEAFQFAKYYFPEKKTPNIFTYISEFTYQRFIFDNGDTDGIALGLDMFLGEDYPYSKYVPNNTFFSSYLSQNYNKENIVRNTAETLAEDWLGGTPKGQTLLDKMLYHGKKLYIISRMIPYENDNVVMAYTPEQYEWCEANEQEMWSYFFQEELFYSTDINKITTLVNPSPHAVGMPPEAPGRTANYIGWKIIEAFMSKNGYEPQEILTLDKFSAQKILEMSKFKPKRN
jgi:hypothetical protein